MRDASVAKASHDGTSLVHCVYIGGPYHDKATVLGMDSVLDDLWKSVEI
jgi:hypothetical protein